MTNKEAIEIIKAYKDRLTSSCSNQLDEDTCAFEMAIKALEFQDNIKEAFYSSSGFELKNYIRELLKGE